MEWYAKPSGAATRRRAGIAASVTGTIALLVVSGGATAAGGSVGSAVPDSRDVDAVAGGGAAVATSARAASRPAPEALLLSGALIVDGSGDAPYVGEVLVVGERIAALGPPGSLDAPEGATRLDLSGLALAPGFIDIHNHSTGGLVESPQATTQIAQGITTLVVGADGGSPWPLDEYLAEVEASGPALNVAAMVGHGTLRRQVMGDDFRRAAGDDELVAMAELVERGMRQGGFGLSTGLEYDPGFYSTTEEVVRLAAVAARHGGFYMSHVRDEEAGILDSIAEAIRIGEEGSLPVQISHIKMGNASVWGGADEALQLIGEARDRGLDVTADQYPYEAWASSLSIVVTSRRFDDPDDVAEGIADLGGPDRLLITRYEPDPDLEGLNLAEIAERTGRTPVEQYIEMMRQGGASVIGHTMHPDDVETFMSSPFVMVSSDGGIGGAHPRGAGTFPRVLGRYVRERGLLSLETAVRKMTAMPARRLGLEDRGRIREGLLADLVAFDPDTVIDRSTFTEPQLLPEGIEHVWVAGREVWRHDAPTGERPGRVLRHPGR